MYNIRKNSQRFEVGLISTLAANAREERARKVTMDPTENFIILLMVVICRQERISRDFGFEKSPRSSRSYMVPWR